MKIRCINNTGESLRPHEYKTLEKNMIGRFGATGYSEYGGVRIGENYLVMGIIIFESYLGYLIDDRGSISVYPCQLFEVIDSKISGNWHYRLTSNNENLYPFIQGFFGYYELCFVENYYVNLIIEMETEAQNIYFRRKEEMEM